MRILIIDGQGGGIGSRLAALLRPRLPEGCELLCAGTNALATSAMLKAGAARGATGEHAIVYNAQRAHLILGPMGILLANGILGEVSPAMAAAVSGAECKKVLIPSSTCGVLVAGTEERRLEDYLNSAVDLALGEIARLAGQRA
ncbi:MAG TPA: DUF3842 family protein [Candidatus Intestinimonas pullistercoris]|uniref:DUF3842 family protein n=1 Tax=Candidatus Intestinimonas pullistercoris TaxID=2838623 RepID=A0A9D2NX12_9FIRM|nr:DUF3842 family protein [uncultured Intestinimonas sp.]HJC40000.1 DUF3842 family protein [Candidatus Intestinimonas pullistercoris]